MFFPFVNRYLFTSSSFSQNHFSHDHALGITRLNVYAGLVGFYVLRDNLDTGREDNLLGLPAGQYELAYAVQVSRNCA